MSSTEHSAGYSHNLADSFAEEMVSIETLERTLACLAQLTGVSTVIVDLQGNVIATKETALGVCALIRGTEKGRSDCAAFRSMLRQRAVQQKKPCQVLCRRTGMVEACVPVMVMDRVTAVCHIGPCTVTGLEKPSVEAYLSKIGLDPKELAITDRKGPRMTPRQFLQLSEIPWLIAQGLNERRDRQPAQPSKPEQASNTRAVDIIYQDDLHRQFIDRTEQLIRLRNEFEEFAYVVSHDLKAPLRAASQLARWIVDDQGDSLNEDGKEMINLLTSRLDRMNNLLDGILQYSRVGRISDKKTDVDVQYLLQSMVDTVVPADRFSVVIDGHLPPIRADQSRIETVFAQLIANAVKFMDKPHGEIHISCMDGPGQWKFAVRDNGPGIDETYHEKIFRLFQTLAPRDELESTGAGLTIAKKALEAVGGAIWVESAPGQGATFFFTLPKMETT